MFEEINTAQMAVLSQVQQKYYSDYDLDHAEKVSRLSLTLFDMLSAALSWPQTGRNLLYCGAMLHDIGHYINEKKHDRHSCYIINNESLLSGWPEKWRLMTALIAGGHRKKLHSGMEALESVEQELLLRLIAVLRIADAMDFYHGQNMEISRVDKSKDQIVIFIKGPEYTALLPRLQSKAQTLQKVSGRTILFSENE